MSEPIDLYDNARRFVCVGDRYSEMPDNLNKVSVHVWFINNKKEFLLQQRVASAKKFPNMWGQTGGGSVKGETSWDTCVRESMEELGIKPEINQSVWIGTFKRPKDFVDVWLVHTDVDIEDLKFQPNEVQNAKWKSLEEIKQMQEDGTFIPSILLGFQMVNSYLQMMESFDKNS